MYIYIYTYVYYDLLAMSIIVIISATYSSPGDMKSRSDLGKSPHMARIGNSVYTIL